MGRLVDAWRSQLLTTLSGDGDGRPRWVDEIEHGDDEGFFEPGSAAWAVTGGMPTLVAGIRALLLQTLHPGAMAGVHDYSRYREDPLGRLAGTVRWIVTVTFGDRALARRESGRVGRFHERVKGTYRDAAGVEHAYAAGDADLLLWVHDVFTESFLACHTLWEGEPPGGADRYVREWAVAGELVGVQHPPRSAAELQESLRSFRPVLQSDERVAEAVRFIRNPPLKRSMMPAYRILFAGAVASIPEHYRRMLGLRRAWWPAVTATRVLLAAVGFVMGGRSTSEEAARRRIAALGTTSSV